VQISRGRKVYFHGKHVIQPSVDLVIADMPEGLPVPGLCDPDHVIPLWNAKNVDSIQSVFSFCKKYLHDDGALLVFQPLESRKLLMPYLKSASLEISLFWTCYNGMMLTHPILPNQKVIYLLSHIQS
jgi:hypothetical protein